MGQNITGKIIRFLNPIKDSPLVYIRAIYIYSSWGINWVIHIFFLQKITFALETKNSSLLNTILLFYIAYFIYFYLTSFLLRNYWWTEVNLVTQKNIQKKYIEKFIKLNNTFTEKYWVWKSISIIERWFDKWWEQMHYTISEWSKLVVYILFTAFMLLNANSLYLLIFILILIWFYIISHKINYFCIKYRIQRWDTKNLYTKQIVKIIMSKNEIFQSSKINNEINILDEYINKMIHFNKKMWLPINWLFFIPDGIILVTLISVFYFLWKEVLSWNMSLATLVWISWSIIIMQKAIENWIEFYKNITKDFTVIENLWNFFDNTPEIEGYDTWKDYLWLNWTYEVKNLNYAYVKNKNVFEDFDLKIEGWKKLAIVWPSWWGKTTLIKLLSWYIKQDSWDIIIDNQNTKDISLKSYYENIWYLTQDPSVFDWSVYDNITYSIDNDINESELKTIIKLSKCDFIYDLPKWINTEIWERWVKLSWWQKQRLAIAKIMLKNPKIILLDEPTSAMDSFNEDDVNQALYNLFKWKTVIIIAHRLQTVKNADRIIYIENWKIIEDWTHSELVKFGWKYKKMLDLQSGF